MTYSALTAGLNHSVVRLSKYNGSATEIAQFQLGDLTFKVQYPHYIYSSALVKVLWDICISRANHKALAL